MKQKQKSGPTIIILATCLCACLSGLNAQDQWIENWQINPDKELNPNTKWLREAKWGLFFHYMAHQSSAPIPDDMNSRRWNKKVNSFQEKKFADQLSERDLVAELGKELNSRGIRLCVYLPAKGRGESPEIQEKWRQVIREWSNRWSKNVSARWIDGAKFKSPEVFKAYTAAFKSGNPNALVS